MRRILSIVLAAGCMAAGSPALAQFAPYPPELQNRIPAPLPAPERPPVVGGPLAQSPAPGVYKPRRLNTYGDRLNRCLDDGAGQGLKGRRLNSYARSCANAN